MFDVFMEQLRKIIMHAFFRSKATTNKKNNKPHKICTIYKGGGGGGVVFFLTYVVIQVVSDMKVLDVKKLLESFTINSCWIRYFWVDGDIQKEFKAIKFKTIVSFNVLRSL